MVLVNLGLRVSPNQLTSVIVQEPGTALTVFMVFMVVSCSGMTAVRRLCILSWVLVMGLKGAFVS